MSLVSHPILIAYKHFIGQLYTKTEKEKERKMEGDADKSHTGGLAKDKRSWLEYLF